jgi:hypothetical protein
MSTNLIYYLFYNLTGVPIYGLNHDLLWLSSLSMLLWRLWDFSKIFILNLFVYLNSFLRLNLLLLFIGLLWNFWSYF